MLPLEAAGVPDLTRANIHEENIALSGTRWLSVIPTRGSADENARRSALDNNRLSVWRKTSLRQRTAGEARPRGSHLQDRRSDVRLRESHQPCGDLGLTIDVIGQPLGGVDCLFQGGRIEAERRPDAGWLLLGCWHGSGLTGELVGADLG